MIVSLLRQISGAVKVSSGHKYVVWTAMPLAWLAVNAYQHMSAASDTLLPHRVAMVSPLPIVWFLVLRQVEAQTPLKPRVSIWPAIALAAFTLAGSRGKWGEMWLWVGMFAACIAFVPVRPVWTWIRRNTIPASIALLATASAKLYTWINGEMWFYMCKWNGQIIQFVLNVFQEDVVLRVYPARRIIELTAVETIGNLKLTYYKLRVYEPCSGLEGAFVFLFLLSATILLDYDLFRRRRLLPIYLIGAAFMLVFNSIRILFLFQVAAWAWKWDASGYAKTMRGWPLEMFHSYTGLTLYLIAFGVFTGWLYRTSSFRSS